MGESDTDILVMLIGDIEQQQGQSRAMANIIMDCGVGKKRLRIDWLHDFPLHLTWLSTK